MAFCTELAEPARAIWARELKHPFVQGLGKGDLAEEKFRWYLIQDYLFLVDYAKVFALAATKAKDVATMGYLARLASDTLNSEMALHRQCCAEFGIAAQALEQAEASPTTRGYCGHLLRVAWSGDLAEIIASVLPCQWGYSEIALHLQKQGMPAEVRYRNWIEQYASAEFSAYGAWLREQMERFASGLNAARRADLQRIFLESSRWELRFWEMAWRGESWS